jgi:hypothetical protein
MPYLTGDPPDPSIELRKRIEQLEDAIDVVIEELAARGQGKEKVGSETLLEFLERTLKTK